MSRRRLIFLASFLTSLAVIAAVLLYWRSEGWAEQKLQDYLKRLEDSGCTTEERSLTDFDVSNRFTMQFFGDFLSYARQEDINHIYFDRGMHALYFLHSSAENGVEAVIFYYKWKSRIATWNKLITSIIQLFFGDRVPFTPFHLGPALLFGLLLFGFLDFPTFLIANAIVDLEPFLVILFGLDYPLHGFFHSFVGGTIVAVALAVVMFKLSNIVGKVMKLFRLDQEATWKSILAASLLGVYSHILLDTPLYPDIRPFYPLDLNPYFFSDLSISIGIYMFCIFSLLAGFFAYVVKLALQARTHPK